MSPLQNYGPHFQLQPLVGPPQGPDRAGTGTHYYYFCFNKSHKIGLTYFSIIIRQFHHKSPKFYWEYSVFAVSVTIKRLQVRETLFPKIPRSFLFVRPGLKIGDKLT